MKKRIFVSTIIFFGFLLVASFSITISTQQTYADNKKINEIKELVKNAAEAQESCDKGNDKMCQSASTYKKQLAKYSDADLNNAIQSVNLSKDIAIVNCKRNGVTCTKQRQKFNNQLLALQDVKRNRSNYSSSSSSSSSSSGSGSSSSSSSSSSSTVPNTNANGSTDATTTTEEPEPAPEISDEAAYSGHEDPNCVKTAIIGGGEVCDDGNGSSIYQILNLVVDIMTIGVGILGVIGIGVSGVLYLTAGDKEDQTKKAKRRMLEIVIGLVVYVVAYALLKWLLPGFNGTGGA